MRNILILTISLLSAAFGASVATHDGPHGPSDTDVVLKVGKTGEVKIGADLRVSSRTIPRGKYVFEHRIDGDNHVIVLTGAASDKKVASALHEIPTRWVTSRDNVKSSLIVTREQRDRSYHVTSIKVAGENGDHIPY